MQEVVWLVGSLFATYAVARFLVFLKKKTEKKGGVRGVEGRRGGEEKDKEMLAVVIAGIVAQEEEEGGNRKKGRKRVTRGRKAGGFSWWRASGRKG